MILWLEKYATNAVISNQENSMSKSCVFLFLSNIFLLFFRNKKLKQCSNCRMVYYCDETCEKRDRKHHELECALIKSSQANNLNYRANKFIIRLLLLYQVKENSFENSLKIVSQILAFILEKWLVTH